MRASKPTIFDQAFPFLELRQIQASQSRADARRVPNETQDPTPTNTQQPSSPAAYGPSCDATGKSDTQADTSVWEEEMGAEKSEGSRKRRKIGALLRLDESVVVKKARGVFFQEVFVCRSLIPPVLHLLAGAC